MICDFCIWIQAKIACPVMPWIYFFPLISLQVYGPETTQKELFEGTVKDLVKDVLEGGNSLVFTYGATNAGKTFTFLGLYFFHIVFKLKMV